MSLYLYFAVIGMIDTASTAEELKITLADFLENRMSERLAQVKRDNDYLDEQEREVRREVESVEQTAAVRRMQEPRQLVRVDRAGGVSGLKCCVFCYSLGTASGESAPDEKNPGGRRNEPQK